MAALASGDGNPRSRSFDFMHIAIFTSLRIFRIFVHRYIHKAESKVDEANDNKYIKWLAIPEWCGTAYA